MSVCAIERVVFSLGSIGSKRMGSPNEWQARGGREARGKNHTSEKWWGGTDLVSCNACMCL